MLAVLVVDDVGSEMELASAGDLKIHWVHREATPGEEAVVRAVARLHFPAGRPDVFVHGEAGEVRAVRKHSSPHAGLAREGTSISPYWRRDFTDEAWREVKRDWMAQVEHDVPAG